MTLELIRNLIMNAALLLAMSILFNMFFMQHFENEKAYNLRIGIIVGIIGMFLMINTVTLPSNVIFDTRSILVSITGLFMGVIPTGIAVLIISIYRILIGGVGAFTGVMTTAVTAGIGLLWRHFRWKQIISNKKQVGLSLIHI